MISAKKKNLESLSGYLPDVYEKLAVLSGSTKARIQEIRLREGRFVTLELTNPIERVRLDIKTTAQDLEEILRIICRYSVHTYAKQLASGYITIDGGHRVGFCGTAVMNGETVQNIRELTSMNFRVANEFIGCSDMLFSRFMQSPVEIKGLLLIGRPLSAKTTMLRDLVRNIGDSSKVTVIDERGELAAKSNGKLHFDLGANTDVLDGFPKAEGFITALRTLSPDFIACDEIGFEHKKIELCVNSGVRLLLTAHCSSYADLKKSRLASIIESGGISHIALLGDGAEIGKLKGFWEI